MGIIYLIKVCLLLISLSSCTSVYYQPHSKIYFTPAQFGYPFKELQYQHQSGEKIKAWLVPAKALPKKSVLVVQFHGNAENRSTHIHSLIWLADAGADILSFDYRGYGDSEGIPTPQNVREDVALVLSEVMKLQYDKIVLVGQSLGGAALLDVLVSHPIRDKVHYLVLDSTFISYKRVAVSLLGRNLITLPFSPLAYLFASDETAVDESKLVNLSMRKLVMHAEGDPVIPFYLGEDLFEKLSEPKILWRISGDGHVGAFNLSEKEMWRSKFISLIF